MSANSEPDGAGVLAAAGTVSFAMDDLVYGYERLERTLPGIAAKVTSLQSETEDMAQKLEVTISSIHMYINFIKWLQVCIFGFKSKMKFLVDGFEHLDVISTQIPESIRELASNHKNSLLSITGKGIYL